VWKRDVCSLRFSFQMQSYLNFPSYSFDVLPFSLIDLFLLSVTSGGVFPVYGSYGAFREEEVDFPGPLAPRLYSPFLPSSFTSRVFLLLRPLPLDKNRNYPAKRSLSLLFYLCLSRIAFFLPPPDFLPSFFSASFPSPPIAFYSLSASPLVRRPLLRHSSAHGGATPFPFCFHRFAEGAIFHGARLFLSLRFFVVLCPPNGSWERL